MSESVTHQAKPIWARSTGTAVSTITALGTQLDAADVRRSLRTIRRRAGLAEERTPRELRHTFVSLLSDNGMAIEEISRLVGHSSSNVTETVYGHQIRPVITVGAEGMGQDLRQRAVISVRPRDLNSDPLDANEISRRAMWLGVAGCLMNSLNRTLQQARCGLTSIADGSPRGSRNHQDEAFVCCLHAFYASMSRANRGRWRGRRCDPLLRRRAAERAELSHRPARCCSSPSSRRPRPNSNN